MISVWHLLSCENCGEAYSEVIHTLGGKEEEAVEIEEIACARCKGKSLCLGCDMADLAVDG